MFISEPGARVLKGTTSSSSEKMCWDREKICSTILNASIDGIDLSSLKAASACLVEIKLASRA